MRKNKWNKLLGGGMGIGTRRGRFEPSLRQEKAHEFGLKVWDEIKDLEFGHFKFWAQSLEQRFGKLIFEGLGLTAGCRNQRFYVQG